MDSQQQHLPSDSSQSSEETRETKRLCTPQELSNGLLSNPAPLFPGAEALTSNLELNESTPGHSEQRSSKRGYAEFSNSLNFQPSDDSNQTQTLSDDHPSPVTSSSSSCRNNDCS